MGGTVNDRLKTAPGILAAAFLAALPALASPPALPNGGFEAAAGAAAAAYVDTFFIHLDAQGALILLFMPVWQWVAVVIGLVVASLLPSR